MSTLADLAPKTRGGLKTMIHNVKEWLPYRENREPGEDG